MGLRGSLRLTFAGTVAVTLMLGCSIPSLPNLSPPPPSEAAAPWVGCYVCDTSITGIPQLYFVDGGLWGVDGSISATFTNGLSVSASADTLTGWISDLDSGAECFLQATALGNGKATLYTSSKAAPFICDLQPNGELVAAEYSSGAFALDGGLLTGKLAVWFPLPWCGAGGPPCDDAGEADGGIGSQVSSCTRLDASTCPWR